MGSWDSLVASLDRERQLPAVRETRNAVVAAGAGSGKTRVLSVRYLALIKERRLSPERILCLTFTNKAAAEMKERIRGMLRSCASDDQDFARALGSFASSRISTLDSFCSEIARNGSAARGIAPDFGIDEDASREATRDFTLGYLLAHRGDAVLGDFIAANGFENALEALCSLAQGREGIVCGIDEGMEPSAQESALRSLLASEHGRIADALRSGMELGGKAGKTTAQWLEAAAAYPEESPKDADAAALAAWRERWRGINKLRKPTDKNPAGDYFNGSCDAIRSSTTMAALACDILLDPRREKAFSCLHAFLTAASEQRAASSVLSFSDVAALARETLIRDKGLRAWYKKRFDAIMIDEFQDNNALQKDLLFLLAEDRSAEGEGVPDASRIREGALFFVGDEKQSIYAFRGADVRVFRGLARELENAPGGLGYHELSVNWRSEPGMISFFNEAFAAVLPSVHEPSARDYEARFAALEAGPPTEGVEAVIEYREAARPSGDGYMDAEEAQARDIAALIRQLRDSGAIVSAKGPGGRKIAKPCEYEDIAVLFRSTAAQNVLERHLRLADIPYTAVSTAGLYVESVLGDLYAALRLAAFPDDRHAYAAALRGPLARLTDEGVVLALENRDGGAFSTEPDAFPPEDRPRYLAARSTWLELSARADREPLAALVEWLWYDRGLRWNVLADPANAAYLEHFDYAWAMASRADSRGQRLCDFVAELEGYMDRVEKLDLPGIPRERSRGVSIMTVHASKGLEFPVVILPSLENIGRNGSTGAITDTKGFGRGLKLLDEDGNPASPLSELQKLKDKRDKLEDERPMSESLAESARLFYVACTRAISRLYLVGKLPANDDREGRSFRSQLLRAFPWLGKRNEKAEDEAPPRPEDYEGPLARYDIPALSTDEYKSKAGPLAEGTRALAQASAEAAAPALPFRVNRLSVTGAAALAGTALAETALQDAASAAGSFKATGEPRPEARDWTESDFGTLCHERVEAALMGREAAFSPSAALARKLDILPAEERRAIEHEAAELAGGFMASPRAAQAREAFRRAREEGPGGSAVFAIEYPFVYRSAGPRGPVFLSGAMDLVYGDEFGVCVLDFKTDRCIAPERHAFQLGVYREAAGELFCRPARAFLYYLRHGTEVEASALPEEGLLHEALARDMGDGADIA